MGCSTMSISVKCLLKKHQVNISKWNQSHLKCDKRKLFHFKDQSKLTYKNKRKRQVSGKICCVLDTGANTNGNDKKPDKENSRISGISGTRLGRIVRATANQLFDKLNKARSNFPTKTFLLLLGYYTANALATIIGQTGDWDVLVAGIAVAAIEGIGILMYRTPIGRGRLQSLVSLLNFWKAGLCLGLFVDAFKLGS